MKEYIWCKYNSKDEVIVLPDNSPLEEGDEVKIISLKHKGRKNKWLLTNLS